MFFLSTVDVVVGTEAVAGAVAGAVVGGCLSVVGTGIGSVVGDIVGRVRSVEGSPDDSLSCGSVTSGAGGVDSSAVVGSTRFTFR